MKKKLKKAMMLVLMLCMIVSSVPATEVSAASTTQMKTDIGLDVNGMYVDETLKQMKAKTHLPMLPMIGTNLMY